MRAILVANPKGGCGKTTLATNIAGHLAQRGDAVTLWDLDRQKSSLNWLALRPVTLPTIARLDADRDAVADKLENKSDKKPEKKERWLVIDSPAGLHGKNLAHALKLAQKIIIPVQPSVFDMAATRDFIEHLLEEKRVRKHQMRDDDFIAMVGMRVHPRTRAAATLQQFLAQYDLPVLTHIRDTVVYANAAFQGMSLFDLPPYQAERDLEDWQPLLAWLHL